jgi:hypothetical protein
MSGGAGTTGTVHGSLLQGVTCSVSASLSSISSRSLFIRSSMLARSSARQLRACQRAGQVGGGTRIG